MKKDVKKINLTIDDFLDSYEGCVGYVYPYGEDSFYVQSGIQCKLHDVQLEDGSLFAEHSMRELLEAGFPCTTFVYDDAAYEAAVAVFNATAGQDDRPAVPMTYSFRVNQNA